MDSTSNEFTVSQNEVVVNTQFSPRDSEYMDAYFDGDDDAMQRLVDEAAYEAGYAYPAKKIKSDDIRDAKYRASAELDNIVEAGDNFRTAPDGRDGHTHENAVGDYKYFDTIFKVGNDYYKGVINIRQSAKGSLLTDVTKIENITKDISSSYGQNPKSTFLRDVSMDSILHSSENINTKFSDRDSEGNELTEAQQEFFKDSKARDEQGRLVKLYHGTKSAGFTEFAVSDDIGYFFTDSLDTAWTYLGSYDEFAPNKIESWEEAKRLIKDVGWDFYEDTDDDGDTYYTVSDGWYSNDYYEDELLILAESSTR